MTGTVFLAVLAAAFLHAAWNALVKGGADKRVTMAAVMLGHMPPAIVAFVVVPAPAWDSWPWMVAGMLAHLGYQIFLLGAYTKGDLSQVYPIARGLAPLVVTFVSFALLGERLSQPEFLAVGLIGIGLMSMALLRGSDGARNMEAVRLALMTGCFIASYSLIDGYGARASGSPIGFYAWSGTGNAALFALYLRFRHPGVLRTTFTSAWRLFFIGGTASFTAYGIVIWAFTQAPIALVTALRETSIVFAVLIGVVVFKERLDRIKIIAVAATLLGAGLLRLAQL
ncbi:DMT family transporter [Sulfitobacter sp. F26169L]|uniref:DMT family transporter n=1 Tax=Sulfitobacter sp. F26169L TaxID=2996015 RepID=UPI002260B256|nr:DMT family transporter [Sulfitobacter sp. F26169L]MCX7565016.1 DMT family transporter [Sulfitobacter sp. F26169L]